jgi:hypothetical protein
LPSKFFTTDYGASLRTLLTESKVIDQVVDFGHAQVFENATTYTCLLFLDKSRPRKIQYLKVLPKKLSIASDQVKKIPADSLGKDIWIFLDQAHQALLDKINTLGEPLLALSAVMSRGTSTGDDNIFCLVDTDGKLTTRNGEPVDIEREILRRPLYATDFTRYHFCPRNKEKIVFPYIVYPTGYKLIEEKSLREKYPKTYEYLRSRKKELESRKQYKHWYAYSAPRNLHIHDQADLLVPLLADHGIFAPTAKNKEKFCVMASAGFSVSLTNLDTELNPLYVLGLLNSKLLFWNLQIISNKFRGGWITCTKQYFGTLPIRTIDFSNSEEVAKHDKLVALVDNMLELQKNYHDARMERDKELYERQIKFVDSQIDRLVYELYELTEEEVKVVEGEK